MLPFKSSRVLQTVDEHGTSKKKKPTTKKNWQGPSRESGLTNQNRCGNSELKTARDSLEEWLVASVGTKCHLSEFSNSSICRRYCSNMSGCQSEFIVISIFPETRNQQLHLRKFQTIMRLWANSKSMISDLRQSLARLYWNNFGRPQIRGLAQPIRSHHVTSTTWMVLVII